MFALSSVRPLVAGAFAVGSFSGVRVEAAASGPEGSPVALLFFFRSASAGEAFVSWLAARAGVSASCGRSVSLFSWVVVLPLSGGVAVPAAPVWVPLFRGGSPSGLAGAVVRSLRLPA